MCYDPELVLLLFYTEDLIWYIFWIFLGKSYVCLLGLCVSCSSNCISPLPLNYLCFQVHYTLLRAIACCSSLIHGSHYACTVEKQRLSFFQLCKFHFGMGSFCVERLCAPMYVTIKQRSSICLTAWWMKKTKHIPKWMLCFRGKGWIYWFSSTFLPFKKGRAGETLPTHWVLQASAKRWR